MRLKTGASKFLLLVLAGAAVLAHRSDAQQPATLDQQLRLSRAMPRGAIAYIQAANLSALMRRWLASEQRAEFYKSPSFEMFSRSRIYLKLAERIKDFEKAVGFGISDSRLAELAGGASAFALYDVGKTEITFITEVPRARAVAGVLFKQSRRFDERKAEGVNYYMAEVVTDEGRLRRQFCFAHAQGRLIITTTEALMIRTLRNIAGSGNNADTLFEDLMATARRVKGLVTNDLTMWIDQQRLNSNPYFSRNWLHRRAGSISEIETGIIDMRLTLQGMRERRWFVVKEGSERKVMVEQEIAQDRMNRLASFAPADAHLVEVHGPGAAAAVSTAVSSALFTDPKLEPPADRPSYDDDDENGDPDEESLVRRGRYAGLDLRFDSDYDDDQSPFRKSSAQYQSAEEMVSSIRPVIAQFDAQPYCKIARSKLDQEKLFVMFDRAVVLEMKDGGTPDRTALEQAVTDEVRRRFVVAGIAPDLKWQSDGEIRFLAQSLLQGGAAYAVMDRYLMIGSSKQIVADCIRAARLAPRRPLDLTGAQYAVIRVGDAKPVFDRLMAILDGRSAASAPREDSDERQIQFFSENLSSLVGALDVREVHVSRKLEGAVLSEQLSYLW